MWDKGLFGKKEEKYTENQEITNSRYKLVQNVVSKKWVVLDTQEDKCIDLVGVSGFWWGNLSTYFHHCWTRDKAQAAFEAICETGKIWK